MANPTARFETSLGTPRTPVKMKRVTVSD